MNLLKKINPAFLLIPVAIYYASYLYATKDQRRFENVEAEQRKELCITGSKGSMQREFADEHGYSTSRKLGCIEKLGVPEGIENFAQLKKFVIADEAKRTKEYEDKKSRQQEREKARNRYNSKNDQGNQALTLARARQKFGTQIQDKSTANESLPLPPDDLFVTTLYHSGMLQLPAFVTPNPHDGKKHPAIVWITGGESNTLGEFWQEGGTGGESNTLGEFWQEGGDDNDQSASPYRKAGMIMMFPTLRGGNHNMGSIEYNYGEVNDVMAAAEYLATLPYVDRHQIYLGGHSTGGTLVLLTSEVASSINPQLFKAVISFGSTPYTLADLSSGKEKNLRSPSKWISDIRIPTWIIEGEEEPSNADSLKPMCNENTNTKVQCIFIKGHNHFDILTPVNQQIAAQIVTDGEVKVSESAF